jgi:hypothetical protein
MKRMTPGLILVAALLGFSDAALANEYTNVIDAADSDNNDPFDANISVSYLRTQKSGKIVRESIDNSIDPHPWDHYAYRNMFEYRQVEHILNINVELGLYKDLALKIRLPLILNDQREVTGHGNWDGSWQDATGDGNPDELFPVPFKSPERSGVDYFAMGLWWGIFNQDRDETKPFWVIFAEGRFGVGSELKASCVSSQNLGGGQTCADLNLDNRGGVGRGLNELAVGSRVSRRFGYIDPYFGLEALIGWAKEGSPIKQSTNADGFINDKPPIRGTVDFGLEIVPWEVPERGLKFTITVGGTGTYFSEGREFSPLFDALGTSQYFLNQTFVDFNGNGTDDGGDESRAADQTVNKWTGMTDVENYLQFLGKIVFMIQPSRFVKFILGFELGHETEHFITKTDQCTLGNIQRRQYTDSGGNLAYRYECDPHNYAHRPEIDSAGNRFRAEKTLLWNFYINATAMF